MCNVEGKKANPIETALSIIGLGLLGLTGAYFAWQANGTQPLWWHDALRGIVVTFCTITLLTGVKFRGWWLLFSALIATLGGIYIFGSKDQTNWQPIYFVTSVLLSILGGLVILTGIIALLIERFVIREESKGKTRKDTVFFTDAELRSIFDQFIDEWPNHNEEFNGFKPQNLLPSSKFAIKSALKWGFENWNKEIHWTEYSAFAMEFADLGMYLDDADFDLITRFENSPYREFNEVKSGNALLLYKPRSVSYVFKSDEQIQADIDSARDFFAGKGFYEPIEITVKEFREVGRIVLRAHVEVSALAYEWQLFLHSLGRNSYLKDEVDSNRNSE